MVSTEINTTTNKGKAMTQLLKWLDRLLSTGQSKSALETFIISKNPNSTADIERWTREYEHRSGGLKL